MKIFLLSLMFMLAVSMGTEIFAGRCTQHCLYLEGQASAHAACMRDCQY